MPLKPLLRRLFPNSIHLRPKTAKDLKELAEQSGLPPDTIGERIIREHLKEELKNKEARKQLSTLTPRVRQAALLHSQGYRLEEIGEQLGISPETVKAHLRTAMTALGLHTRRELREALKGMVEEEKEEG